MAIGLGALWAWSPGCSQPKPECNVGTASAYPYIAKFIPQGTDCAAITGDYVGMQVYNPASADNTPDLSSKQVALQTGTAGDYLHNAIELDDTSVAYSIGTFSAVEPDDSNMCSVATLTPAHMVLPLVPGEGGGGGGTPAPAQVPVDVEYRWSNLQIYVTPANLGNQAEADLTFADAEADCTANYHVVMLWPAVSCQELDYFRSIGPDPLNEPCDPCDPDPALCEVGCNPAEDSETCEDDGDCCEILGTCRPFPALCDGEPDPQLPYELPAGSGISPDLRVVCDPTLLHCVLDGDAIQRPDG